MERVKSYNVNELLEVTVNGMEGHFKNKLLTISSGSFDGVFSCHFKSFTQEDDELQVREISVVSLDRKFFSVKPSIKTHKTAEDEGENVLPYLVDMDLGYCTCPIDRDGSPCKHQHAVVKQHSLKCK